jgi:D-3-phosphoglycerate dehydrogenase / 2-oxoglutarate reductase
VSGAGRRRRVVATARAFCASDGPHQAIIREAGLELVLAAGTAPLSAAQLAPLAADADGLLLGLDHCDASVFAAAPRLRVVARFGAGVDTVDLEAAARHGVTVTNTPNANTVAVAELTLALLLTLARDLPTAIATARSGGWARSPGWELDGKTLGIVGLGRIGRAVAVRAAAFGMRVIGHDPYVQDVPGVVNVDLDELWASADAISLHLGLDARTRHLVDGAVLVRMKRNSVLINTSRGGLVDEAALAAALRDGTIAAAAADAFDREPPTGSPLLELPNFVPTPHLGAATREAARRMGEAAARNVVAVLTGRGEADAVALPGPRRSA